MRRQACTSAGSRSGWRVCPWVCARGLSACARGSAAGATRRAPNPAIRGAPVGGSPRRKQSRCGWPRATRCAPRPCPKRATVSRNRGPRPPTRMPLASPARCAGARRKIAARWSSRACPRTTPPTRSISFGFSTPRDRLTIRLTAACSTPKRVALKFRSMPRSWSTKPSCLRSRSSVPAASSCRRANACC